MQRMSDDEMLVAQSSNSLFPGTELSEGVLPVNNENEGKDQRIQKPRKRVTFDMQLQIHTIPNRIPMYERRPAYNNVGSHPGAHYSGLLNRGPNQRSLLPRPLDIKTRDRYLIGAANLSTKRIIDLFGSSSSRQVLSPSPNRQRSPGYRNTRRVPQYASPTISSNARLTQSATGSTSPERQPVMMSRAAANLKQITDAIGEEAPGETPEEQHLLRDADIAQTISNVGLGEGVSSNSPYGSGQLTAKTRVQSSPARVQNNSFTQNSAPSSYSENRYLRDGAERLRPSSLSTPRPEPLDGSKLPLVTSEQIQLSYRYMTSKVSAAKDDQMRMSAHGRSDFYKSSMDETSESKDVNGNVPNRTPSRCSTIDAYVIDGPDQSNINSTSMTASRRTGSAGRGHRRLITTPPSRAWEGLEMAITQPSLQVSALRTAVNFPHQSSPVSSYLSTSTSQRNWTNRNPYS